MALKRSLRYVITPTAVKVILSAIPRQSRGESAGSTDVSAPWGEQIRDMTTLFDLKQDHSFKGFITTLLTVFAVFAISTATFAIAILSESTSAENGVSHVAVVSSQGATVPSSLGPLVTSNLYTVAFLNGPLN